MSVVATLCRPQVSVPEHVVTAEETLHTARTLLAGHPQRDLVLRLITNTGVRTRHLLQPLEQTLAHPGFETRNLLYEKEAKRRLPQVVEMALAHAELRAADIDMLVYVSCTGFMMPSMTAHLINTMGFRTDTRQLPIAQLGCAAGGAAVNRAHDFVTAYPGRNVLIVACEFCSLLYQPTDLDVGSLLSNGLFGDAMAAAVVRGDGGGQGIHLEHNGSHLVPDTEDWISYAVRDTGFHFRLDKRVPHTMEALAPALRAMAQPHDWDLGELDFYLVHAGGPRILDDLGKHLSLPAHAFRHSRATLTERGNIASAVVFDALARLFAEGGARPAGRGVLAGFGPGITAEISLGHWSATPAASAAPTRLELPGQRSEATLLYHVAPLTHWLAQPDRPYAPASLARDGSVHCLPAQEVVLASATRFHRETTGPLVALVIDQGRLDTPVEWTAPAAGSPLDGTGLRFPRIRGPINRTAVVAVREIVRDAQGRALELLHQD